MHCIAGLVINSSGLVSRGAGRCTTLGCTSLKRCSTLDAERFLLRVEMKGCGPVFSRRQVHGFCPPHPIPLVLLTVELPAGQDRTACLLGPTRCTPPRPATPLAAPVTCAAWPPEVLLSCYPAPHAPLPLLAPPLPLQPLGDTVLTRRAVLWWLP